MNDDARAALAEAARLVRSGRLGAATGLLKRLLPGTHQEPAARTGRTESGGVWQHVPEGLRPFLDRVAATPEPRAGGARPQPPLPPGARFVGASFRGAAGTRPYKLYVPGRRPANPMPLVVMLHGCTQSPDDFAAGTRMNELAEAEGFLVAYPAQTTGANPSKCWNWFRPEDQRREGGEPAILAGIIGEVVAAHPVDAEQLYVAGLSAGGAAAAVLAATYPDLIAAVGIHSGLACGAARDLPSALEAMRQGAPGAAGRAVRPVPTIVFHGDRDQTVNPANADWVIAQAADGCRLQAQTQEGRAAGGRSYRRVRHVAADGRVLAERWTVHGAGHAWSGGSPAGSYTDPQGPDASRAMYQFFRGHRRAA